VTAVSSPSTSVGGGARPARTPRQRLMLLGLVVVLLVLARASTAFAGTFVVASCPGDAGWGNASTTASFISYSDDCSSGGTAGIGMTMGPDPYTSTYDENSGGSFSFAVPSQYSLSSYTLTGSAFDGWCSLDAVPSNCEHYGEGQVIVAPTGPGNDSPDFDELGQNSQAINLAVTGLDATGLTVSVGCNGGAYGNPCPTSIGGGPEASVTISSAAFWLTSDASPTATGFSGTLLAADAHGTADLAFTANDPNGPGVYNIAVLVDGNQLYSGTPNTNSGQCAAAGTDDGVPVYSSFQPCLQTEGVDLPIDTTGLADGSHDLQVIVTDAAGNSATVLDQTITTANLTTVSSLLPTPPPASTASPVYAFALDQSTAALGSNTTRTYDNSSLTMSGTLDDEAAVAAPGVSVTAWARPADGSAFSELAQTTTDGAGRWTVRLPKGSSRVVNIIAGTGATPANSASTVSLTETVTPTLSLSISTPGRAQLVFSGEIGISPLGTPRPLVFIEVHGSHGWQTVGSPVRVDVNGRYRYVYASSPFTVGRRFVFRAVTPAAPLWPVTDSHTHSAVVR
jgi:hypothetical protein